MLKATKSRNNDTPVMMSGFSMGMSFRNIIALRFLPRILYIPIAEMLPMKVEIMAARIPMLTVFSNAFRKLIPTLPERMF